MWNLIKMDFYRLFSSKAIKIGALMACIVSAAYMLLSLGIVEIIKLALKDTPEVATEMGFLLSQVAWINGVDFSDIVLNGTAAFSLFVGCMIAANFIGSEQSCGYTKNFAGQLPNRGYMVISKFIVTSFIQLMVLVIYTIISVVFAQFVFGQYVNGYQIDMLFAGLGLRLLLHIAVNAVIIFICTLTKSHAIAMVAGCIFGIGITKIAYMGITMILNAAKIKFEIANYMPDGINSQIAVDSIRDIYLKAILVSFAFIVVFVGANYYVVSKRDVK